MRHEFRVHQLTISQLSADAVQDSDRLQLIHHHVCWMVGLELVSVSSVHAISR